VPINTAYEGEFLRHQVVTVRPRWAVVDDVHAARFAAIAEHCGGIEHFWVIDSGQRDAAIELLASNGWAASPWEDLESAERLALPAPPRSSSPPAPPARPRVWRCRTRRCTSSATRWSASPG
jgi:crotonobetaine/carnitine-CoA ligase